MLSVREQEALCAFVAELGIDRSAALELHRGYLDALARVAWEDGIISDEERADLHQVAALLGLSPEDVECALEAGTLDCTAGELDTPRFA